MALLNSNSKGSVRRETQRLVLSQAAKSDKNESQSQRDWALKEVSRKIKTSELRLEVSSEEAKAPREKSYWPDLCISLRDKQNLRLYYN